MADVETQASQRTVVAFISGLLIGGLLVWIFSSTPSDTRTDEREDTDTEVTENTATNTPARGSASSDDEEADTSGMLTVGNQEAGTSVELERVAYPSESGWVVVREHVNGVAGNVLGAARYDVAAGLAPSTVELARATVAGGTYEVLFYTNEGALTFSLTEDKPVAGAGTKFTAN